MSLLESDEEDNEGKEIKILAASKLLTGLLVLLAQLKAVNYSYKLMNKIRQFNQVIVKMEAHIEDNKLLIITEHKIFKFDFPGNVDNNWNDWKIDSVIKHELLAEYTIKIEIRWSFSKYKHGSNIHKHGKQ